MTKYALCARHEKLDGVPSELPPSSWSAIYVVGGVVRVETPEQGTEVCGADEAVFAVGAVRLTSEEGSAEIVRWSLVPKPTTSAERQVEAGTLAHELELAPGPHVLRCDRVEFPPGGIAYLHRHAGPGVRSLLTGSLTVETAGARSEYGPGDFWFEIGPSPVRAEASSIQGACFARVMILPAEYKGRSSITYLDTADEAKQKPQRYSIFIDEEIQL